MKNVFRHDENFNKWLIELRRYFHQYPELSFKEFNTRQKIMETLDLLGIENEEIANTGVIATITGSGKGKTIALRADIDALKITEEKTELNADYLSRNKGIMHACGHDGHIAMVLGAARKLHENRNDLAGNVKLIFQPAEEVPPGGAAEIIEKGGLDNVDAIIGIHLFANINSGEICLKEGPLMASNCKFNIEINGKSGHHFNPEACIDPIQIASEFVSAISKNINDRLSKTDRYVFGIGTINGGEQFNQTPDQVLISGSYRALDNRTLHEIERIMRDDLNELMAKHQKPVSNEYPNYHLEVVYGYPVLCNHPKFTRKTAALLRSSFTDVVENIEPVFASDDFACYLEKKPGTYIFLGVFNKEKGIINGNHSSKFDIDESVLTKGTEIFVKVATDFFQTPCEYL